MILFYIFFVTFTYELRTCSNVLFHLHTFCLTAFFYLHTCTAKAASRLFTLDEMKKKLFLFFLSKIHETRRNDDYVKKESKQHREKFSGHSPPFASIRSPKTIVTLDAFYGIEEKFHITCRHTLIRPTEKVLSLRTSTDLNY